MNNLNKIEENFAALTKLSLAAIFQLDKWYAWQNHLVKISIIIAFIYFENLTLENIGAFLLNTPKTWILLEWNLVKSALVFSSNLNVPKTGIILIYQIENQNAKMHKYSKNSIVRLETLYKYFVWVFKSQTQFFM